nr:MAG: replication initiator protein [Microvirus sp.]
MQCFKPYTGTHNGRSFEAPCGQCVACNISRAREWSLRLLHEKPYWDNTSFLTLTYDDASLPTFGTLFPYDLVTFFKRLRKKLSLEKRKLKYYACGEYGDLNGRPHYHSILFGVNPSEKKLIEESWNQGRIDLGTVTYDSCRYVAQYVDKKYFGQKKYDTYNMQSKKPPFQIASQGFGLQFANENNVQLTQQLYTTVRGQKCKIPRYYIKKLKINTEQIHKQSFEYKSEKQDKLYKSMKLKPGNNVKKYHEKLKSVQEQSKTELLTKIKLRHDRKKI